MIFFCCSWMLCMVWPSSISFWNLSIRVCNWSFSCFCCTFKSFSCLPTRLLSRSSWMFFCKTVLSNGMCVAWALCQKSKAVNKKRNVKWGTLWSAYLYYAWLIVPQFSPSTRYFPRVKWKRPIHYSDYVGQYCRQAGYRYFCSGFFSYRWISISESVFRFVALANPFPRPTKWNFHKTIKSMATATSKNQSHQMEV